MTKKTDKKIAKKAKSPKRRKNISRKKIVSDVRIVKKIRIACERTISDRKNVRIPVTFVIPVRVLKMEPKVAYSFADALKRSIFSRKFVQKVIAAYLVVAVNWFSILTILGTEALFNDTEASQGNVFQAGTLDFSVDFLMSDGFTTYSQGGWGSEESKDCIDDGENGNGKGHGKKDCEDDDEFSEEGMAEENEGSISGSYLDEHFDDAFADGLTIGNEASGYFALFNSSNAIKEFLPAGKTPGPFSQDHEDPSETEAGVLAGQAVALTLNVGFDNFDEGFSLNDGDLEDLNASDFGIPCEKMAIDPDMTVGEILAEANLILSGQMSEFSPSEMNKCVTEINERFHGGERTKIVPEGSVWREIVLDNKGSLNFQHGLRTQKISGDEEFCDALLVQAYLNGVLLYTVELFELDYSPAVFSDPEDDWKLFIRLPSDAPSSLSGKVCGFKYIVSGWQEDFDGPDGGFSDLEEIADDVKSGEWESEEAGGSESEGFMMQMEVSTFLSSDDPGQDVPDGIEGDLQTEVFDPEAEESESVNDDFVNDDSDLDNASSTEEALGDIDEEYSDDGNGDEMNNEEERDVIDESDASSREEGTEEKKDKKNGSGEGGNVLEAVNPKGGMPSGDLEFEV